MVFPISFSSLAGMAGSQHPLTPLVLVPKLLFSFSLPALNSSALLMKKDHISSTVFC